MGMGMMKIPPDKLLARRIALVESLPLPSSSSSVVPAHCRQSPPRSNDEIPFGEVTSDECRVSRASR